MWLSNHKNSKGQCLESLAGWWTHGDGGEYAFGEHGSSMLLSPYLCPMHLFYLAIPKLYPFKINQWSNM